MKATKNTVVAISYELHVEGLLADQASAEKPLEYTHGTGMLLPKFEENIEGKEPGETFEFTLSPEEGYGERNPEYVAELPKEAFMVDGKIMEDLLVVGNVIPMLNSAGQVVQGIVTGVSENGVTMDFNHPMAGKTLNFTGKVESVREATEEELQGGCHCGGGCHGGCHGGDCGGDCNCGGECGGEGDCGCGCDKKS